LFLPGCLRAQETPKKMNNNLFFLGQEKSISIGKDDSYHIFPLQERVVFITSQLKPNYSEYLLYFYDFWGNEISRSDVLRGSFVFKFIENKSRVFAGQTASLITVNKSYLFDVNGNLINVLSHDYDTKQVGITEDNNYVWFAANKMRALKDGEAPLYTYLDRRPYNHVMLFDAETGEFESEYSIEGTNLDFLINGRRYSILLTPPDLPG
jgi:hypothetical protein